MCINEENEPKNIIACLKCPNRQKCISVNHCLRSDAKALRESELTHSDGSTVTIYRLENWSTDLGAPTYVEGFTEMHDVYLKSGEVVDRVDIHERTPWGEIERFSLRKGGGTKNEPSAQKADTDDTTKLAKIKPRISPAFGVLFDLKNWTHIDGVPPGLDPSDLVTVVYKDTTSQKLVAKNVAWSLVENFRPRNDHVAQRILGRLNEYVATKIHKSRKDRLNSTFGMFAETLNALKSGSGPMQEVTTSTDLLKRAIAIQEERASEYEQEGGERSMAKVVSAFNIISGREGDKALSESDGLLIMCILKMVRGQSKKDPHRDSVEDFVSYSSLFGEVRLKGE
jgi:hypothetical protein